MAVATSSVPVSPHLGDSQAAQSNPPAISQEPLSSFIKFDEKQATVFVNIQHIVRFEYHASTGQVHLQLSDGHHYYLSDAAALRVLNQLDARQLVASSVPRAN